MRTNAKIVLNCVLFAMPVWCAASEPSRPLQVMQLATLSFGTFSADLRGGSVIVDARSGSCQPVGVVMIRNFCEQGKIEIRGQPEAELMVEIVPQGVSSGGAMLKNLTIYPGNGVIKLGYDGKANVQIGGELVVNSGLQQSAVQASYLLNINYLY